MIEKIIEEKNADSIRYTLLTNKINLNFLLVYEVALNNYIKNKLFVGDLDYRITNIFYNFYRIHENDSYEVINLIKQHISPLKKYTIIDYNSGIGLFTILFSKLFKKVISIDNNVLNFEITKNNVSIYNKIDIFGSDCLGKNKYSINTKDIDIDFVNVFDKKLLKIDNTVLFLNFQFVKDNLKSYKNIKNKIIILSSEPIKNIHKYFDNFCIYKLINNYIYFIL